jgi:hypothetical protein
MMNHAAAEDVTLGRYVAKSEARSFGQDHRPWLTS